MYQLKPISDSVSQLSKDLFARKFVALSRILSEWEEIIGSDMAGKCQPIRLKYQKPKSKDEKPMATLEIAASSADASVLAYKKDLMLARINHIFGDKWINDIKFDHSAVRNPSKPTERTIKVTLSEQDIQNLDMSLSHVQDEEIKKRLEKLGQGVLRKRII